MSNPSLSIPFPAVLMLLCTVSCAGRHAPDGPTEPGQDPKPIAAANVPPAKVANVLSPAPSEPLRRFGSKRAFDKYLADLHRAERRDYEGSGMAMESSTASASPAAPMMEMDAAADEAPPSEPSTGPGESITNTQEANVDEGGIVKARGDHLVVLRRGRLFTVKVGDRALTPISSIDIAAEGHDAWYDEMLIEGDTIIVIGFSYQVGATELARFHLSRDGKLSKRDTFFLRSNDYYSSRNYASRLVGDTLVFYMPHALGHGGELPAVTRTRPDDWHAIIREADIYKPIQDTPSPVLHTVVRCDLSRGGLDCNAQGILGPWSRSFYVSSNAVYVWVHEGGWDGQGEQPTAVVYRIPIKGKDEPGALRVFGAPVDQFSFKEGADDHLNVLVQSDAQGEAMWGAERSAGDVALLRVPVAAFQRGVSTVSAQAFVDLPEPENAGGGAFQNRFVGDHVLYGTGNGWGYPTEASEGSVLVHAIGSGPTAQKIGLAHGVDRIEALGGDAVIVGGDGRNLHFTALDLGARTSVAGSYVQRDAAQGELRSHGFFFKPEGEGTGVLGLPIRGGDAPGYEHLVNGSASVLFLGVEDLNFQRLGALASSPAANTDDRCVTSCVDWYGNARPIFYDGRVFALLGYELVEGAIEGSSLREVGRVDMLSLLRKRGQPIWKAE